MVHCFQAFECGRSAFTGGVLDALKETYEDLVQAGTIDPTKLTRTALQNVTLIAGLLLTTEAIIV